MDDGRNRPSGRRRLARSGPMLGLQASVFFLIANDYQHHKNGPFASHAVFTPDQDRTP